MNRCVVCHHQARYFVGAFDVWTFLTQSDLNWGRSPVDKIGHFSLPDSLKWFVNLSSIHITLNDVEDWHVLSFSCGCAHHDIVWMQKSSHHIQYCGFSYVSHLSLNGQWSVSCHKEMTPWSGNQWSHQADHIVVHIVWVSQSGGGSGHDGWYDWVDLGEVGIADFQPVDCDLVQGVVVQNHNWVWIVYQPLEGQYWVIRLDYNVWCLCLVGKHRIRRYDLFTILIIEPFEQIASQPTSCTTGNWVQYQKALQRLRPICLSINHVQDFLLELFSLCIPTSPTVTGTTSLFWYENVFRIVQIWMRAGLNCIDDLKSTKNYTLGSRSTRIDLGT